MVKAGKKLGPLHGVPMTIKESYDVAGLPTTWGHPAFKDTIVKTNALVTQRMIDAGVTLFGKTNVPLNLADWQSYNEVYGSTNNPWDLVAHAGRLVGRLGRGAGRRTDRHRSGQRHRRLDPQSRFLQRRVGPQADLGRGLAARPCAERPGRPGRHQRVRAAGARRGGSRDRHGRDGGSRRHRRPRLDAHPAALEEKEAARLQGRGAALRPQRRGRPFGAGRDPDAGRLPRQEEGQGERQGQARHRHRGAGRRLCPHAAGDDVGPA